MLKAFRSQPLILRDLEIAAPFVLVPVFFLVLMFIGLLSNVAFYSTETKQNIKLSEINFENYSKVVAKIGDHIRQKEGGERFDSDSFGREAKKGRDLINAYTVESNGLQTFLQRTSLNTGQSYRKSLETYHTKAIALVEMEKDAVRMYAGYMVTLRVNEEVAVNLAGEKFYMYTAPERYQNALNNAIKAKQEIVKSLEALELQGIIKDINSVVIKKFNAEISYLEEVVKAVNAKNIDQIASLEQNYKLIQQQIVKEFNAWNDQLEDRVDKELEELLTLREQALKSYQEISSTL